MIHVTKSYLPSLDRYIDKIKTIWENHWLTNHGPILDKLELQLKRYLGTDKLLYTNNGTIVLQMALKALDIQGEVITTPFSYVATTNAILWEGCTPVFADIREDDFNIDVNKIEACITPNTKAILATHVFGNPCDVKALEALSVRYKIPVIYDGAHAFGVQYEGKSLLTYGDMSTCSFHATKVFHTIEGGCIIAKDDEVYKKLYLYRQFGHHGDDYYQVGVNAKSSEFHAAMGLCVMEDLEEIIAARKLASDTYNEYLDFSAIRKPQSSFDIQYNYAYYPIVFSSEEVLLAVKDALAAEQIFVRRYFYPSLNTLPFLKESSSCPISEEISKKIICLPLSTYLTREEIQTICQIVNAVLQSHASAQ
ncbi:MAG: hypothetical protein RIQ62_504 [Bacteroidota bacterium]|jgi:dTDP-4-amino-4,6-dideoxygalactose transaminase